MLGVGRAELSDDFSEMLTHSANPSESSQTCSRTKNYLSSMFASLTHPRRRQGAVQSLSLTSHNDMYAKHQHWISESQSLMLLASRDVPALSDLQEGGLVFDTVSFSTRSRPFRILAM